MTSVNNNIDTQIRNRELSDVELKSVAGGATLLEGAVGAAALLFGEYLGFIAVQQTGTLGPALHKPS